MLGRFVQMLASDLFTSSSQHIQLQDNTYSPYLPAKETKDLNPRIHRKDLLKYNFSFCGKKYSKEFHCKINLDLARKCGQREPLYGVTNQKIITTSNVNKICRFKAESLNPSRVHKPKTDTGLVLVAGKIFETKSLRFQLDADSASAWKWKWIHIKMI